ncbi:unnamed protein product [Mucor hiemalis]
MVIMTFGACLTLALLPASKVVRSDGSQVSFHKISNWKRESVEVFKLFKDIKMIILIPLFAGSNWFYTYQWNEYNAPHFMSIRARALNNLLYWAFQIIGAGLFGTFLDSARFGNRRKRALIGNAFNIVIIIAIWIGAIFVQKTFTRESILESTWVEIDVFDKEYPGYVILYALFGLTDAIYQGFAYWLMGTMTNDTERAARYGGFYKTIQNAAAAIANQLEAVKVPYMTQLIITFALNIVGLVLALLVSAKVPDVTVEEVDNLQDGVAQGTLVGGHLENNEHVSEGASYQMSDKVSEKRAVENSEA